MSDAFIISDIHLTDNPAHEYRWKCLDDFIRWCQQPNVSVIIIAGDIFDAKDRHSSELVNRFMRVFGELVGLAKPIIILRGNHDYIDPSCPFLHFLRFFPQVTYVDEPMVCDVEGGYSILAVPHGASWDDQAPWRREMPLSGGYAFILAHQTFCGATVNGEGFVLEKGPSPDGVSSTVTSGALVISGDIHQAQSLGNIEYIGSPHPVVFGESGGYFGRFTFETGVFKRVKRRTIQRISLSYVLQDDGTVIEDARLATLSEGDHVQIVVTTSRVGVTHYAALRQRLQETCDELKVSVFKIEAKVHEMESHLLLEMGDVKPKTDTEIVENFCVVNSVEDENKQVMLSYVDVSSGSSGD